MTKSTILHNKDSIIYKNELKNPNLSSTVVPLGNACQRLLWELI